MFWSFDIFKVEITYATKYKRTVIIILQSMDIWDV